MNLNAEYEMHIPNCTQKGVENCGGFLFDNETGEGGDMDDNMRYPKNKLEAKIELEIFIKSC